MYVGDVGKGLWMCARIMFLKCVWQAMHQPSLPETNKCVFAWLTSLVVRQKQGRHVYIKGKQSPQPSRWGKWLPSYKDRGSEPQLIVDNITVF